MPVPRPRWWSGSVHRRMVPPAMPSYPQSAVVLPNKPRMAAKERARPEQRERHGSEEVGQPVSDAVAQWLFSAQAFERMFDVAGGTRVEASLSPLSPLSRAAIAAAAPPIAGTATATPAECMRQHLNTLTALVTCHLPSPVLVSSTRHSTIAKEARNGEAKRNRPLPPQRRSPSNAREQDDAATAAQDVLWPHQQQMVSTALTHLAQRKGCFQGSRSCGAQEASRDSWPWDAERALVVGLVASLCTPQRESLDTLALLLSLVYASPTGCSVERAGRQVCSELEEALTERGHEGSCLPWLLYRLCGGGAADQAVDDTTSTRWLQLATQQLCASAWADLRHPARELDVLQAPQPRPSDRKPRAPPVDDAPPSSVLTDLIDLLAMEAKRRVEATDPRADAPQLTVRLLRGDGAAAAECFLRDHPYMRKDAVHLLDQRVASLPVLSASPTFHPFVLLTLTEMLASAWEALGVDIPAAARTSTAFGALKKATPGDREGGEFKAVGAYQALRRFASSLSKHQRLQPLLELSALVSGSDGGGANVHAEGAEPMATETRSSSFCTSASQWRHVLLCERASSVAPSALLWRELALFDAYTLITVGHVSERALDFDDVATHAAGPCLLPQRVRQLQSSCLHHLRDLTRAEDRAKWSEAKAHVHRKLTPRTRAELITRLQEGLRLSAKVFLRMGDTAAVCDLYTQWPDMGGSWEVGKALTAAGESDAAVTVFSRFFADTRQQYAAAEVPLAIRQVARGAVEGLGHHIGTAAAASAAAPAERNEVAVRRCLERYGMLKTWHPSLPPAVCADALVRGLLRCSDGVPPAALQVATLFLSHLHQRGVDIGDSKKVEEGLLTATVETFVEALLRCRGPRGAALSLLVDLMHRYPELPILRTCLTRFLRAEDDDGVAAMLRGCCGRCAHRGGAQPRPFSEAFLLAQLNTFPIIALEGLAMKRAPLVGCSRSGDDSSSPALPRHVLFRVQAMAETALAHQMQKYDEESLPWQCVLCRTWNNRFAAACKLCQASSAAAVQCAACDAFGSTRDAACQTCGASFDAALPSSETASEGADGRRRSFGLTAGVGRDADTVLSAPCYKAVHALRPWRCQGCHHHNEASHAFYCASCGSAKPEMAKVLHEGAYTCPQCRQRNAMGALRPWCATCGSPSPNLTAICERTHTTKSMWLCLECRHINPWLLVHCDACGGGRPPIPPAEVAALSSERHEHDTQDDTMGVAPLLRVPWRARSCASCAAINSVSSTVCRACSQELGEGNGEEGLHASLQRALQLWRDSGVFSPADGDANLDKEDGEGCASAVEDAKGTRRCRCCSAILPTRPTRSTEDDPLTASAVSTCPHCHALQRSSVPVELWVCLHGGCLHVNLSPETAAMTTTTATSSPSSTSDAVVHCLRCRCARGPRISYVWQNALPHSRSIRNTTNPLGYRSPSATSTSEGEGLDAAASVPAVLDALVVLPPPSIGRTRRCRACENFLETENVIGLCPRCGHCNGLQPQSSSDGGGGGRASPSAGFAALQLRLLFRHLHGQVCCSRSTPAAPSPSLREPQLTRFLLSLLPILRDAREDLLPWRGCDVLLDMRCAVEPRAVMLLNGSDAHDGEADGCLDESTDTGEVLHSAMRELRDTIASLCEMACPAAASGESPSHSSRRVYLLTAVELVELSNRSTDYDEIGFPTLAKLCLAIRPDEAHHIQTETRWAYLSDMKLSRRWIIHGAACEKCLGQHGSEGPCTLVP